MKIIEVKNNYQKYLHDNEDSRRFDSGKLDSIEEVLMYYVFNLLMTNTMILESLRLLCSIFKDTINLKEIHTNI